MKSASAFRSCQPFLPGRKYSVRAFRRRGATSARFCASSRSLFLSRRKTNDFMPGGILNPAEFGTDRGKITPEFARMLPSVLSDFLNNWIFHLTTSNNSSGEQTSEHSYPSLSMTFLIVLRLNGLLRWPIFQVMMTSIPFTAATAM